MKKERLSYLLGLSAVLALSGCVVRTYPLTRDRVDQDLTTGNRGFIQGSAPKVEEKERPTTRTTEVVEVELRSPIKFEHRPKLNIQETAPEQKQQIEGNRGYITNTITPEIQEPGPSEKYTVQKGDTLQKISKKYYGTTKRWKKIYDNNKAVLKTPNSLRPGQVLDIPTEGLKEPKENLK